MSRVIVIGAGLQGVCVALALSKSGHQVAVVDQAAEPMTRASLRNEGKIHLGFTYANEPSMQTAKLCLRTGLEFADLIDGWLPEKVPWAQLRSRPFTYLVMRDSQVDPETIAAFYETLTESYLGCGGPPYLGASIDSFSSRVAVPSYASPNHVVAAFETAEVALDLAAFRAALMSGWADKCNWLPGHKVDGVAERSTGFDVGGTLSDGTRWTQRAEAVVNCSWEGRVAIDKQVGLLPTSSASYRLKYRVLARLPRSLSHLPSVTMVLGAFGDIVPMPRAYLSWYPASRTAWSDDLAPPDDWQQHLSAEAPAELAGPLSAAVLSGLDERIPGIAASRVLSVDAGVVVAPGSSDIDDPNSGLHARHSAGVFGGDGYFSIDTGKLGYAPRFAADLVARL